MAHEVSAFQPVEAGFWLSRALRYFPAGTLHVAVVDPGVGTPRDLIVALSGEQALLAPDNGLLAPLAARGKIDRIIRVDITRLVQFGVSDVSATFHGRDVFAPLAAAIASGRCDPADLGPRNHRAQLERLAGHHDARGRRRRRASSWRSTASATSSPTSNRRRSWRLSTPTVMIGGLALPLQAHLWRRPGGRISGPHQLV